MTEWTKEELVASLSDSIQRREEYLRKIEQEEQHQESLYELLGQALMIKKPMPRFDE